MHAEPDIGLGKPQSGDFFIEGSQICIDSPVDMLLADYDQPWIDLDIR